jgi:hypothetical protein
MLRFLVVTATLCMVSIANADSSSLNLQIPTAPGNHQYDKFRAGDLDCQNAIGSATYTEFGVTGIISRNQNNNGFNDYNDSLGSSPKDVGVYARIIIPLGAKPKARINCNELYQLELKKKRLEVMKLEQEIQQLRQLQFEN